MGGNQETDFFVCFFFHMDYHEYKRDIIDDRDFALWQK